MTTITLTTKNCLLRVGTQPEVTQGSVRTVRMNVSFDSNWDDYKDTLMAVFGGNGVSNPISVEFDEDSVLVPWEVMKEAGEFWVYVVCIKEDGAVKVTNSITIEVSENNFVSSTGHTTDPSPTVYTAIVEALGDFAAVLDELNGEEVMDGAGLDLLNGEEI